jgi:NTE family protein
MINKVETVIKSNKDIKNKKQKKINTSTDMEQTGKTIENTMKNVEKKDKKKTDKKSKRDKENNEDNKNNNLSGINTLVLSGGSLKGISYIGVFKALNEYNILKNIKTFAGTSIGGIIAVLYVIGYTSDELSEFINLIDFEIFRNINIEHFLKDYGLDNGKQILFVFEKMFKVKNINKNITFIELYQKTGINLVLTGVCINDKKLHYISHESFPDMQVLTGLRITSSIPFLFTPVKYNEKLFIDGGIMNNYPINKFNDKLDEVIGVYLNESYDIVENINNLESYFGNTLECIFAGISSALVDNYKDQTIKLILPRFNILDFRLSIEDKENLYKVGYEETIKFLENMNDKIKNNEQ